MSRICTFTGKHPNNANLVSHSNIKTQKWQLPNLHVRRLWWDEGERFVQIKVSARAMRTIRRKGLGRYARELGIDLAAY